MPPLSRPLVFSLLLSGLILSGGESFAVDETPGSASVVSAPPLPIELSRQSVQNFLSDKEAIAPHLLNGKEPQDLTDIFIARSPGSPFALFWDPASCRLIGVLDLTAPKDAISEPDEADNAEARPESPFLLKAAGPSPLAGSPGANGNPSYFGFRVVGGCLEFLYTFGTLAVEERLWLEGDGTLLKQRFFFRDAPKGVKITLIEDWKKRVESSAGDWARQVLSIPASSPAEVTLTYQLRDKSPESESTATR